MMRIAIKFMIVSLIYMFATASVMSGTGERYYLCTWPTKKFNPNITIGQNAWLYTFGSDGTGTIQQGFCDLTREKPYGPLKLLFMKWEQHADTINVVVDGVYEPFVMQQMFRQDASADTLTLIPDFMGLQRTMTLISTPEPNLFKNKIKR